MSKEYQEAIREMFVAIDKALAGKRTSLNLLTLTFARYLGIEVGTKYKNFGEFTKIIKALSDVFVDHITLPREGFEALRKDYEKLSTISVDKNRDEM